MIERDTPWTRLTAACDRLAYVLGYPVDSPKAKEPTPPRTDDEPTLVYRRSPHLEKRPQAR